MMKKRKVAVVAGTPVDTKMGVQYIESRGEGKLKPIYHPVSESCDAQLAFQYESEEIKREIINDIFDAGIKGGVRDFFIYCNSLSGAFDFDAYEAEKNTELKANLADGNGVVTEYADCSKDDLKIRIYTPLQVYRELGGKYSCVGLMAAHNLSAHAIEEALMSENPDIYVIGTGNMAVVKAIEDGISPGDIAEKYGLSDMLNYMKASGAEAVILGCTHFPYLRDAMSALSDLPLIDPADLMLRNLLQCF